MTFFYIGLAGNDLLLHKGRASDDLLLHMSLATLHLLFYRPFFTHGSCYCLLLHMASSFYPAFFYTWAFTFYPTFSYTWALDQLLFLLLPRWHHRVGHFMDTQIRLNIFVPCQRRFPSLALRVFSIRMHLSLISIVSHFRHFEYSAYGCT